MRRLLPYLLLFLLVCPYHGTAQVTDSMLRTCPTVSDLGTPRVICSYGTNENPYANIGISSDHHSYNAATDCIQLGNMQEDNTSRSEGVTYLYRVDTTQTTVLTIYYSLYILCYSDIRYKPWLEIGVFDSMGNPLNHACAPIVTRKLNSNGYYHIRLRPYHNQTLSIRIMNHKPRSSGTTAIQSSIRFECCNTSDVSVGVSLSGCWPTFTYSVQGGCNISYPYRWYDDELGYRHYQLYYNALSGDSTCVIEDVRAPLINYQRYVPEVTLDTMDIYEDPEGICYMRARVLNTSHICNIQQTPTGNDTIRDYDTHNDSLTIRLDNRLLPDTTPIVTLSSGPHQFSLTYYIDNCTIFNSINIFIPPLCHYNNPLFYSCPSVYDLGSVRTICTNGNWTSQRVGILNNRHRLITEQGTDPYSGGMLPLIPPGENASIRLGDNSVGSQSESIIFYYHVDTSQYDLLLLRYAAVLQNPDHTPNNQPRFTFEIMDSTGNHINSNCYSATYVASTSLGWHASSFVLWKDWTTIGADLSNVHGQMISIRLTTYDCQLGQHFGYAYFTLGCHQRQLQAIHCLDSSYYTAPEGFTYQWYPEGYPDSVVATTREFTTDSRDQFHCRLGFIGAPDGSNCHTLISTAPPIPQYPVSSFDIDTLDTLGCHLRLRLVNTSRSVTEYSADSLVTEPCAHWTFLVDTLPPVANTDTLVITLSPGWHTLRLATTMEGRPCTDTLTRDVFVNHICHQYDTLAICFEDFPVMIEGSIVYGDTTLALDHGDTLLVLTVVRMQKLDTIIVDTTVQNQLPWTFMQDTFNVDFDTLLLSDVYTFSHTYTLSGVRPACDTILHYYLHVWPNMTDSVILFICPGETPFPYNDSTFISNDTAVVYHGQHGEDSSVFYRVYTLANTDTIIVDSVLESQLPWSFFDTLFTDTVSRYPFHLYNEQGCDSTIYYSLYVLWDGDHCDTNLTFPNVVTANGDGINDRFVIGGLLENNCFKYNELHIYDRTGRLVYSFRNIASEAEWWDPNGTNDRHGHRVPDGTYFYIFKAHGVTIWTMHQGVIEVLR